MPNDIKAWIKQLSAKPLPILVDTRKQLRGLMKNENLSISVYAGPVLQDPCMSAILLQDINRSKVAQGRETIGTISNVMPHLGPHKIKQHISQSLILKDLNLSKRHRQGYMRYVSQACHAAYQAQDLALLRHISEPEEMQLAALLQNITEIALWCYGDDAMPEIEQLVFIHKKSYKAACKEVLGCEIQKLSLKLAEAWFMPELAVGALASSEKGFHLSVGVVLASRLARLCGENWYSKQTLQCVQAIADYQGRSISEVEHQLHQNAVDFTDFLPRFLAYSPAKTLPMSADDSYIDTSFSLLQAEEKAAPVDDSLSAAEQNKKQLAEKIKVNKSALKSKQVDKEIVDQQKRKHEAIKKSIAERAAKKLHKENQTVDNAVDSNKKIASIKENVSLEKPAKKTIKQNNKTTEHHADDAADKLEKQAELHKYLMRQAMQVNKLNEAIASRLSISEIIQQAVDACQAHGFERVIFAVKIPKKECLIAKFFSQDDGSHSITGFKIMLDKPHVFKLLMSKQQSIWLQDKNKAKYWPLIPDNVKLALHNDAFFAMSVFAGLKPVGIMYADKPKGKLTQVEYKSFKGVCDILSKGLFSIINKNK